MDGALHQQFYRHTIFQSRAPMISTERRCILLPSATSSPLLSSPLLYSTRPFDQTTIIALTSNESRSLQKSLTLKNVKSFNDLERSFCKIIFEKIHWKNTGILKKNTGKILKIVIILQMMRKIFGWLQSIVTRFENL